MTSLYWDWVPAICIVNLKDFKTLQEDGATMYNVQNASRNSHLVPTDVHFFLQKYFQIHRKNNVFHGYVHELKDWGPFQYKDVILPVEEFPL